MITFFNRKELTMIISMETLAKHRAILEANGIEHTVKTTNLQAATMAGMGAESRRGRGGSFGIAQNASYEYRLYVRKDDYEKAKALLGESKQQKE